MTENPEEAVFPMRLNKYLAYVGIATRRDADELITKGKVLVNGKKAELGMKVTEADSIDVAENKKTKAERVYLAYHKPRGVITHSPQSDEQDIISSLPFEFKKLDVFPVGRLDKDSYGLIILTNDGRITGRLLSPSSSHEKEYAVRTKLPLRNSFKEHMEKGVDIEGYRTKPAKVRVTGEYTFSIVLTEGKKHQIRRMVVAMHNEVTDLKRVRVANIRLGVLKSGDARRIENEERADFLTLLNLPID